MGNRRDSAVSVSGGIDGFDGIVGIGGFGNIGVIGGNGGLKPTLQPNLQPADIPSFPRRRESRFVGAIGCRADRRGLQPTKSAESNRFLQFN